MFGRDGLEDGLLGVGADRDGRVEVAIVVKAAGDREALDVKSLEDLVLAHPDERFAGGGPDPDRAVDRPAAAH